MSKDLSLAQLRELRLRALQARSEKKNDIEISASESISERRAEKMEAEDEIRYSPRNTSPRQLSPRVSPPRRSSPKKSPKTSPKNKRITIVRKKTTSSNSSSSSDDERYGTSSRRTATKKKTVTKKNTKVVPVRRRITDRRKTSSSSPDSSPERKVVSRQVVPRKTRPSIRVKRSPSPSRRVKSPSPSRRVKSPSPSRRVKSPSPSRRVRSPSPSRRVRSPSPKDSPRRTISRSPRQISPRVSPVRQSDMEAILLGFISTRNITGLDNYLRQNANDVNIKEIASLINEAKVMNDLETIKTIFNNNDLAIRLLIFYAENNNIDSFEYVFTVRPGIKAYLGEKIIKRFAKINNTNINNFLSKWYGRTLFDYYTIRIAIMNNNLPQLRNIVQETDINFKIKDLEFPENLDNNVLNWAVYNQVSNEMIQFIINQGVDVNINNSQALILAVAMNNLRITRLLVNLGANYRDHEFELFARAIKYPSVEMIEYLKTIIDYRPMATEIIKFITEEEMDPLIEYFLD